MEHVASARVLRLTAALTAAVLALVLTAGCSVSGQRQASWTLVNDPPSHVSFRLPKKPMLLAPTVTAPDGRQVTVRGYQALLDNNLVVQVSIYDLAGRSFDADKAIKGVASSANGIVISRKHTASQGLDIVDAKIRIPRGPALGYDRVFKIGDHAVQLWTLGQASNERRIRSLQQRLSASVRIG
jgi:hypothetical protein